MPCEAPTRGREAITEKSEETGGAQEGEKFAAAHRIFGKGESLDRDEALRPFGLEPAGFIGRAAHDKAAGRNAHHLRTFGTFAEFAAGLILRQRGGGQNQKAKRERPFLHKNSLGILGDRVNE